MRVRSAYLVAGAAVLIVLVGVAIAVANSDGADDPEPGEVVSPTAEPSGQLESEELDDHWDSERMSEAEPPDMRE